MNARTRLAFTLATVLICGAALGLTIDAAWSGQATLPPEYDAAPEPKTSKKKATPQKTSRKTSPPPEIKAPDANVVARSQSGRFSKDAQGVVTDANTGLQWLVGPDRATTWLEAQAWVHSLTTAGGGWRLPLRAELFALQDSRETTGPKGGARIDSIFDLRGCCVWSSEAREAAAPFHVCYCSENWFRRVFDPHFRAFAVRSR